MNLILSTKSELKMIEKTGGGKALNLFKMVDKGAPIPGFIVISNDFFQKFVEDNKLKIRLNNITDSKKDSAEITALFLKQSFSDSSKELLISSLKEHNLLGENLAVRSSGLDEDSKDHSFAGMFSSFLYQKEIEDIEKSILECWASAYSHRCLEYRIDNKLSTDNIGMGVVIQKMVNSDVSGVMFTRNPMDQTDRDSVVVESVFGQCEGLVSGILEADSYKYNRISKEVDSTVAEKEHQFIKNTAKAGLDKVELEVSLRKKNSLNEEKVREISLLGVKLETIYNMPLDIEWAYERDKLYFVQMRPVTTIPPLAFYDSAINGDDAILWDNSNIVESFAGVTTPLTFSLTKEAYAIVYRQTCRLLDVPEKVITDFDSAFENMLGFVRGRVYYNLINWYKLLFLIPGSASNKGFMETMLGVKEELNDEQQELFNFVDEIPKYSSIKKITVLTKLIYKFITIKSLTRDFTNGFNKIYQEYLDKDFSKYSLKELKNYYTIWNNTVTYSWNAPIINDFLVMFFFGTLKKLTENWISADEGSLNLQNDLLCGQGEIESTMPTITLMKMASKYDCNDAQRNLFNNNEIDEILKLVEDDEFKEVRADLDDYLYRYGFRCNNEQKLEEEDLTTNPGFVIDALKNYVRNKNYSVESMKEREFKIKDKAEAVVNLNMKGIKRKFYFWILTHARAAVKNRENLRFLRSKSFGISRRIFRTIDSHLLSIGVLDNKGDAFYLTYREIFDFIDGKPESLNLSSLAKIRKEEFEIYRSEEDPPDRFLSYGTAGASLRDMQIIRSGDLLKNKMRVSDDPDLIYGISCCPGTITGKVRVAETIEEARNLNGEILITKRTDPGWVPLFPSCSGLIVERGSLLSHSAVIARELGLPTIVGVSASIMSKLKTGDRVELNATQGEIRILHEQ